MFVKSRWRERAALDEARRQGERRAESVSYAPEPNGVLVRCVSLLRRFYVAYHKPEWAEGECAEEVTTDVRLLLDELALDGMSEARVPPEVDDPGGPGPL